MVTAPPAARFSKLIDMLWFERRLLEFLLFKLVTANLVLTANDRRFVTSAISEVDRVMEEVRRAEGQRAFAVDRLASEWGIAADKLSLGYLASNAPQEIRQQFEEHRAGFLGLVQEIEHITRENRRLATVELDSIRGTLGLSDGLTYDAAGRRSSPASHAAAVDWVL